MYSSGYNKTGKVNSSSKKTITLSKFEHLEKAIQALKKQKFLVSVDSANTDELLRGGKAGADYILLRDQFEREHRS